MKRILAVLVFLIVALPFSCQEIAVFKDHRALEVMSHRESEGWIYFRLTTGEIAVPAEFVLSVEKEGGKPAEKAVEKTRVPMRASPLRRPVHPGAEQPKGPGHSFPKRFRRPAKKRASPPPAARPRPGKEPPKGGVWEEDVNLPPEGAEAPPKPLQPPSRREPPPKESPARPSPVERRDSTQ